MPDIIRNLKVEGSTPRSRRPSGEDDAYTGPLQSHQIVGRLTIKDAPHEAPEGPSCPAWAPQRPWSRQKKQAALNLAGKGGGLVVPEGDENE